MQIEAASRGSPLGKKQTRKGGAEAFEEWYRAAFGSRWPILEAAVRAPVRHVAWLNPFAPNGGRTLPRDAREVPGLPGCFESASGFDPPAGMPRPYYLLDAASILAARALEVQAGDRVLDLAAAPGGKTLILVAAMGETGTLVANDRSAARRARLREVLDAYLPQHVRARVSVTGHDAARWALHERDAYQRILLDAPCSSERHVLADAKALAAWTEARPRQLAMRQFAMLASAVDAARSGGRVVYSTCALSPSENDAVVARVLKRRADRVRTVDVMPSIGERTEHGVAILPDRTGWGPIFYSVLERMA